MNARFQEEWIIFKDCTLLSQSIEISDFGVLYNNGFFPYFFSSLEKFEFLKWDFFARKDAIIKFF